MNMHNEDKRKVCSQCDEFLEGGRLTYRVDFSFWDIEENDFDREPTRDLYCKECWNDICPSAKGAEYEIETVEELYDILDSSNGRLVADFKHLTVGSRPFMRVQNGTPELAYTSARRLSEDTVQFYSQYEVKDYEWFKERVQSYIDGDLPTIVYISNYKNTPFDKFKTLGKDQVRLEEIQ